MDTAEDKETKSEAQHYFELFMITLSLVLSGLILTGVGILFSIMKH